MKGGPSMDEKIRIVTIPTDPRLQLADTALMRYLEYIGKAPEELFLEGNALKIDVYKDSNLADLSEPVALEQVKSDEPAKAFVMAIRDEGGEVVGQMGVYDAHKTLPLKVEEDIINGEAILSRFRKTHVGQSMVYLGALFTDRKRIRGTVTTDGMSTIKGIFRGGLIYAVKQQYVQAFACVHPTSVKHYQVIGFHPIGYTDKVKMVKAPGALIRTSPSEIKLEYFARKSTKPA